MATVLNTHPASRAASRRARRLRPGHAGRSLVIKDGNVLLTCPPDGQLPIRSSHGFGLYHHDCRFLSGYELTVGARAPQSVEQAEETRSQALVRLSSGSALSPGAGRSNRRYRIRWHRRLDGGRLTLTDTIRLENDTVEPLELPVSLQFASGFEDIFTVRGRRSARGRIRPPRFDADGLVLAYLGRDGIERETRIHVPSLLDWHGDTLAQARITVPPLDAVTFTVTCAIREHRTSSPAHTPARPATPLGQLGGWTRIETDSPTFNGILTRARDDLLMLRSEHSGHPFYAAGIPWFAALFGRDSLIAGLQVLPFERVTSEGTLRLLAEYQGRVVDPSRDEQPGKILHELRLGELAGTGRVPHGPLYASVDATPLFLILLEQQVAWSGDLGLFEELRSGFDDALAWIDHHGDRDGDGFVEYLREARAGPANQGWKDSWDAIVDDRGRVARAPIALVEVQAYVYRAWLAAAALLSQVGEPAAAARLMERSERLRTRFEREFWRPDEAFYALGLDRSKRPLDVATSNIGHVLWAGLAPLERARTVAKRLLEPDLFTGWGLRTLSSQEARYEPLGYHVGAVWPHDTAIAVAGLRRYGLDEPADRLARGLLEAADRFPQRRLPEAFAGSARRSRSNPRPYPSANRPQAWAAGAAFHLLHSLLGLVADAPSRRLSIVRPHLPAGINRLDLRGLRVGSADIDLHFERARTNVRVDVALRTGTLDTVVLEDWPTDGSGMR